MEVTPFSLYPYKARGLTKIRCGGLKGLYLGGHKDAAQTQKGSSAAHQFFRCKSSCCVGKPLALAKDGGCIFDSGSAFETHAGSQQRKWTCSIKADQEGKDPTPIGRWISKRGHARARRLSNLTGCTIWVLWPAENAFFRGQITHVDAATGLYHVKYADGDKEDLHLFMESYHLCAEKQPEDPKDCHISSEAGLAAASLRNQVPAEKPSASRVTSPQRSYPSPTSRTKIKDLSEVSQDGYSARRAAAMLGKAATGSRSKGAPHQLSAAHCSIGVTAVTSARKAVAHIGEGCSRGRPDTSQQATPGSELDRPSAAGTQQASAGGGDEVISLMSSVQLTCVEESLGDGEEGDDEVTMIWRSSRGSPAAGASAQPPASSSAPAVEPELVPDSGDGGVSDGELEGSGDEDAPRGQSPAAGRAGSLTQPSSAATGSKCLLKEQGSLQAEHLQVLLEAPGIRPTAICLIRHGDVDWLSFKQLHRTLLRNMGFTTLQSRLRNPKVVGPGNAMPAARKDVAFLVAEGALASRAWRAVLVTVGAACNLLRHSGATASTLAAVQGLQGAKPMTPADISSLPSPSALISSLPSPKALWSGQGGDNLETDSEDEVPLVKCLGRKSPVLPVAQRPGQTAGLPAEAHSSLPGTAANPAARSGAREGVEITPKLSQSRSEKVACPVENHLPKDTPQHKQLPLKKVQAAPRTNVSTSEMRKSAGGGSVDAGLRHSRQAKHGERAEWSSSDSEQQGRQLAPQDECVGIESQRTSSPCQSARLQGKAPCCLPTPVKEEDASAAGPKRRSSEVAGICAESLSGGKRVKSSGNTDHKASAAKLPCAKTPRRTEVTAKKATSHVHQSAPESANPDAEEEPVYVSAPAQIVARAGKRRPPPFGAGADGAPPTPHVVEDAELVAEQENLVENIYSRKVFEDYQRRCTAVMGRPWHQGMMSEYFLWRVDSSHKQRSDRVRDWVVNQVAQWLAFSPEQKRQYMDERTQAVELADMSHPAYRRFKEVIEPWGLRKKEHALHFRKGLPEWTLLGEYCGVWDTQAPSSEAEAEEDDCSALHDPIGLGPLLRDKVSELGYTSKAAPVDATNALRVSWADALELDPTRAHNQLCLINDFRNVPGAPDLGNVAWLEMEDSRTLQPHLFIFTAVKVKAGEEALLDYGEEYHKTMEGPLKKAALLLATQPEAVAVHRALKAREQEALAKAVEVQGLQMALRKEAAERSRAQQEAEDERARLTSQAEGERARLTARAEEERASAMRMQQQLAQAREAARSLEAELQAEKACAAAAAAAAAPIAVESRSPSCDADDQALAVREEGLSCSSVAHAEEAEEPQDRDTCIAGQAPEEDPVQMSLARELVSAHAMWRQLQGQLQERDAVLEQARAKAERLGPALKELQELQTRHQEMCKRSAAEIDRLSRVGKEFEWRLAELTKHLVPPGMTTEDLLAIGRTTPLQIVPVRRQHEEPLQLSGARRPAPLLLGYGSGYPAGEPSSAAPDIPGSSDGRVAKERVTQPAMGAHAAGSREICRRLPDATAKGGAKRSEAEMHSRKERQGFRRDERDRRDRQHHSAERHRQERSRSRHRESSRHHRASSGRHEWERPPVRDRSPFRRGSDRHHRAPSPYRQRKGTPEEAARHCSGRPGHHVSDSLHRASPAARCKGDMAADEDRLRHGWMVPRVGAEPQPAYAAPQVHPQRLTPHLERRPGDLFAGSFSTAHREPYTDRAPYSRGFSYRGVPIYKAEDAACHECSMPLTH